MFSFLKFDAMGLTSFSIKFRCVSACSSSDVTLKFSTKSSGIWMFSCLSPPETGLIFGFLRDSGFYYSASGPNFEDYVFLNFFSYRSEFTILGISWSSPSLPSRKMFYCALDYYLSFFFSAFLNSLVISLILSVSPIISFVFFFSSFRTFCRSKTSSSFLLAYIAIYCFLMR